MPHPRRRCDCPPECGEAACICDPGGLLDPEAPAVCWTITDPPEAGVCTDTTLTDAVTAVLTGQMVAPGGDPSGFNGCGWRNVKCAKGADDQFYGFMAVLELTPSGTLDLSFLYNCGEGEPCCDDTGWKFDTSFVAAKYRFFEERSEDFKCGWNILDEYITSGSIKPRMCRLVSFPIPKCRRIARVHPVLKR